MDSPSVPAPPEPRPRYEAVPGQPGAVRFPIYCAARNHLARFGHRQLLGMTVGNIPLPHEMRRACGGCIEAWEELPAGLKPATPLDV